VFCRWRGEPAWGSAELDQLVGVVDRLVVDSGEWQGLPAAYGRLGELFERVAVSDIAWTRTRDWRASVATLWPGVKGASRLEATGPYADALLLAGWLRSRLRRPSLELEHREGKTLRRVVVDGAPAGPPAAGVASPSDLLSEQLDVFERDPVYEAAVLAIAE
jgi:glucose-6-phosphate dehydrogenase assembly protein OpcA